MTDNDKHSSLQQYIFNLGHKRPYNAGLWMPCFEEFSIEFSVTAGNTNRRDRLSTVDRLIKVGCFVKNVNNIFNIKRD